MRRPGGRFRGRILLGIVSIVMLSTAVAHPAPSPDLTTTQGFASALQRVTATRDTAERVIGAANLAIARTEKIFRGRATAGLMDGLAQERRNLIEARRLLRIADGGDDALARSLAAARLSTESEAHAIGAVPKPARPPTTITPSAAALALIALHGVAPTPDQLSALRSFDALPADARSALADVIASFTAFELATRAAYAAVDPAAIRGAMESFGDRRAAAQRKPRDLTSAGRLVTELRTSTPIGLDLGAILGARSALLDAIQRLSAARESFSTPAAVRVPAVINISGATKDDTYTDGYALSIDAGGNDTYLNNAGGNNVLNLPCFSLSANDAAAAAIDLAGADRYVSGHGCGINGGGSNGAGLLVDAGGDDVYEAAGSGANGGGFAGSGMLIDASGNDSYTPTNEFGGAFGGNGGAVNGIGALVDGGGNDVYNGGGVCTNGGACGGVGTQFIFLSSVTGAGFLADLGGGDEYNATDDAVNGGGDFAANGFLFDATGSDRYLVESGGANGGGLFVGTGFLFDGMGSDRYEAGGPLPGDGDGAVNGGGVLGVGMLVDAVARDQYIARQTGVNGGGAEGAGFLIDGTGQDYYEAADTGTNGGAWSYFGSIPFYPAAGALIDLAGNDVYVADDDGANGGGANGDGLLVDLTGNDGYFASGIHATNGGVLPGKLVGLSGTIGITGLLLDGNGTDVYADGNGSCYDCSVVPKPRPGGAQIDLVHLGP